MIIDSHHHLWRYSEQQYPWINDAMEVLARDYWIDELKQTASSHSIDGFVTVQARQSLEETEDLLSLADQEPLIQGVVGWVDLRSPDLDQQLERFGNHPKLKGVRHVVQDEPDPNFLLGEAFRAGIGKLTGSGLVYDILIFSHQLASAVEFVSLHPQQPFVLDHIAKPSIDGPAIQDDYARLMKELAAFPNVVCKFSGVVTEVDGQWDRQTIRPYWDLMLELFGPSRLMFGSDWPVCLLKTSYADWLNTVTDFASELSGEEREAIFHGTAQTAYRLTT